PARDGDHAIGLQVVKVFAKSFEGIKIVFAESKRPGGSGSPGIHQRHLYYVIAVVRATNVRAAILHVDVDLGQIVQVIRVVGVSATHHVIDDNGIDLNASDVGTAVGDGSHHVHASARANNGEVSLRAQHIRERRRGGHQALLPIKASLPWNAGVRGRGTRGLVLVPPGGIHVHDGCGGVSVNHNVT